MQKLFLIVTLVAVLAACSPNPVPLPLPQETPVETQVLNTPEMATPTPVLPSPTAVLPVITPTQEDPDQALNPLTGQTAAESSLLDRRPMVIKVENLPRGNRPQYGLSSADLVYEYYTEHGTTRFAAVFYGRDAEQVGPIRSARFFDAHVVRMYKAVFAFGSAYQGLLDRLKSSEFADRLVIEANKNCPPLCRLDPNGRNILVTNTKLLSDYTTKMGMDNQPQDLTGMAFQVDLPPGGEVAPQVTVHFSNAIYNRWDYDPVSGRYLRWVDKVNARETQDEVYVQLIDRGNDQPISAENVVVLMVPYYYIIKNAETEVFDMELSGSGTGYANRDGQIYKVKWQRPSAEAVLTLTYEDGTPFPFKPGATWFEVMSTQTKVQAGPQGWRFHFVAPPG